MSEQKKLIDECLMTMINLEASLENEGLSLRQAFYDSRLQLQVEAQAINDTEALRNNTKAKRIFCALQISVRIHKGTLQVYWHEVNYHKVTKCKMYKYIPMNKSGVYDLRTLKAKAHGFEWDLVKETEATAAILRARWKKLILSRSALIRLREMAT